MNKTISVVILLASLLLAACSPGALLPPTPTPTIPQDINPVTDPVAFIAKEINLPLDQVTLLNKEQIQWSDGCLGFPQPGEACPMIVTPGYKITLQTSNGVYELHTDLTGQAFRIVPPGFTNTPAAPYAIEWERSGGIAGICQHLDIQSNGEYVLIDCVKNEPINKGIIPPSDQEIISQLINSYGSFSWQVPPTSGADMFFDSYFFRGNGQEIPTPEKQAEINAALAGIAVNLAAAGTPPAGQESGIAGQVLIGPTCPVIPASGPEATQCADKPYQATITVLDQQNQFVTTIQTDAQGQFKVALAPGTYTLHPESSTKLPRGVDQVVTVPSGQFVQVTVHFDSGIR